MSEAAERARPGRTGAETAPEAQLPGPRDQIAGVTFGVLLLSPELTIREVNPAAENLIGRSSRRLLDRHLLEVIDLGSSRMAERLEGEESQLIARNLVLHVGQRVLTVDMTVSPLSSHPGWRVVTLSDAGQGERLSEDDRAAALRGPAVLAHEIKNPLSAIRGAAQLLARKVGEGERTLTSLITDEVDRIASLIDRMQRLGREKAEPTGPCNLHAAIRRACDTVRAASSTPLVLVEEFDPSLPPVLANEGALVQILINLLSNARDACADRDEPRITIRTRFVSGLVMNVFRLGRPVKLPIEVQVSDNGPGIDPSLTEIIFEPFVSSKPNGQGLGLALVNKLVRDMDGRIGHERDEVAGLTHFRLHLPTARKGEK
jgi:two-component system nitrogen regulation sensor histidine kinase GlnL